MRTKKRGEKQTKLTLIQTIPKKKSCHAVALNQAMKKVNQRNKQNNIVTTLRFKEKISPPSGQQPQTARAEASSELHHRKL